MTILEAKEVIKNTVRIYLETDELGDFLIPYMKQRPIFMIGAPGIGKTAIMEQIASEMDIGLVSYSMTHHTRQSAIGLPFITTEVYNGQEMRVSRYTMSEIIASVYDVIERTGKQNGILFLDEINCVSETLSPAILQFLQYKTFGNVSLPQGWIIVSAGNPPEYNKSVKDFDIATRDRLKYIYVEENFEAWRKYAYDRSVHGAIMAFLEVNKSWFYVIRTTVDGQVFATARGWEDLSYALKMYEKKEIPVGTNLILQYITDPDIARKFMAFYALFKKYQEDYRIEDILMGKFDETLSQKATAAAFDERIALIEMIEEALRAAFQTALENQALLEETAGQLRLVKKAVQEKKITGTQMREMLSQCVQEREEHIKLKQKANSLSAEDRRREKQVCRLLSDYHALVKDAGDGKKEFDRLKKDFNARAKKQTQAMNDTGTKLENTFAFLEKAFGTGQELTYFLTILTSGSASSQFIARHGSEAYYRFNKTLLVYDVHEQLKETIKAELSL